MAVGEDVVGADGLTNRQRFDMRREQKRQQAEARAARAAAAREAEMARARAEAEAAVAGAAPADPAAPAAPAGGMLSSQQPQVTGTNPFGRPSAYYTPDGRPNSAYWDELNKYSGEERRYQELLMRGAIDEQGNIYGGINPTEIMRGEAPSWASPELIKNAYIQAFESKARGGQNFMDSGDYQNFLNAGYSLSQDQVDALGGVQGQGNQNDLTFGGGQATTGVANPPPPPAAPAPEPAGPQVNLGDMGAVDPRAVANVSGNAFMDAYSGSRGNQPQNPNAPASGPTAPPQSTPFADAYMRAKQAAEAKGPVSSMFADVLGK